MTFQNVTAIDTNNGKTFADHPTQQVFLKHQWGQAWQAAPYVWCNTLTLAAGPDISHAQLEWRFGNGMQPGQTSFEPYSPLDVIGWYVKVVSGDLTWFGIIEEDIRHPGGLLKKDMPSGVQHFHAYGLDILLARKKIVRSFLSDGDASTEQTEIGRGIPFNMGTGTGVDNGDAARGNGLVTPSVQGIMLGFSPQMNPKDTKEWSAAAILLYLMKFEMPTNAAGGTVIPFDFTATSLGALEALSPPLAIDSRAVKDVLDELVDRRRLVGYTWRAIAATNANNPDRWELNVFTFNDSPITLASGGKIPANLNLKSLQVDLDLFAESVEVVLRGQQKFHQVMARGARRTGTGTFEYAQSTLDKTWTNEQAYSYNLAASLGDEYPSGQDEEDFDLRDRLNASVRGSEGLRAIYTHYSPPTNWEAQVGDPLTPLCPVLDATGEATAEAEPIWRPGLRFMRELPLVVGLDYAQEIPPPNTKPQELRRPFALYLEEDGSYSFLDRRSDRMGRPHGEQDRLTVDVRALDEGFGLELVPHGLPQHALAGSQFEPLDDTSDVEAPLDWKKLSVTAAIEFDAHVFATYPAAAPEDEDYSRLLVLDVPDARLDYLVPQTVVDLDDSARPIRAWGGFVRDDRPRLKNLARLAHAWYSVERKALSVTLRGIFSTIQVGDLITQIGEAATLQTINTVVTSVQYDFDQGTTTFQTDFAEFDPR